MESVAARWCLAALFGLSAGLGRAVSPGDAREDVIAELGTPRGSIRLDNMEFLYFDRGRVELVESKVSKVELVSAEEAEQRRLQAEKEAQARRQREIERKAQLYEEGLAEKARMLADPDFVSAPAPVQAARWKDFMATYPDVPVAEFYARAAERAREEAAREEQARKLAELEVRTQQAEQRAADAEKAAQHVRYTPVYVYQPFSYYRPRHDDGDRDRRGDRAPRTGSAMTLNPFSTSTWFDYGNMGTIRPYQRPAYPAGAPVNGLALL